jgi:hypothetical protein
MSKLAVGCYLIVGQKFRDSGYSEGKPSVRTTKTRPTCEPHEVAVWIKLELPHSLFKRPSLSATISVPEDQEPISITPEVQQNIARVIQEQMGITLNISAPPVSGQSGAADTAGAAS